MRGNHRANSYGGTHEVLQKLVLCSFYLAGALSSSNFNWNNNNNKLPTFIFYSHNHENLGTRPRACGHLSMKSHTIPMQECLRVQTCCEDLSNS